MSETHEEFIKRVGVHSVNFFCAPESTEGGYHIQQNPKEVAEFLSFIDLFKPILGYLEIGSASGGFIRAIHERIGFDYAVMIDDGCHQVEMQEINIEGFKEKVTRKIMDSHDPSAHQVLAPYKFDLIMIDGDHSFDGVIQDFNLVKPHAAQDTLIAFHDIHCKHAPGVGAAYQKLINDGVMIEVKNIKNTEVENPLGIGICKLV